MLRAKKNQALPMSKQTQPFLHNASSREFCDNNTSILEIYILCTTFLIA